MPQLKPFLTVLLGQQGGALLLRAGEPVRLATGGTSRALTRQPISPAQLTMLVRELAPRQAAALIDAGGEATFSYASEEGAFDVRLHMEEGAITANITAVPAGRLPAAGVDGGGNGASHTGSGSVRVDGGEHSEALVGMEALLRRLVERNGSDLHLRVGEPPIVRADGEMIRLDGAPLDNDGLEAMLLSIMPPQNREEYLTTSDTDFAHEIAGLARFRCNALRERRGAGGVFRVVPSNIADVTTLGISAEVQRLCGLTKGLVLVTGPTGSGKSTTLCALVDLINRTRSDHVITIEDPIEFVHENKKCIITQRQVGSHTGSFKNALRAALREDPDIILVGELRDLETVSIAIETAETGHLVFGTLHTTTAPSTIDRLVDQFPADRQEQIRVMLSESLKGVIAQTLCKKIGGGRVAAREILLGIPAVANLIREGKTFQIPSIMQTQKRLGMLMLSDALIELVDGGLVEPAEAYAKSSDKAGFAALLKQRGHQLSFMDPLESPAKAGGR